MPTKRLQCALKYQSTTGFALFGAHQVDVDKIRSKKKKKKLLAYHRTGKWELKNQEIFKLNGATCKRNFTLLIILSNNGTLHTLCGV